MSARLAESTDWLEGSRAGPRRGCQARGSTMSLESTVSSNVLYCLDLHLHDTSPALISTCRWGICCLHGPAREDLTYIQESGTPRNCISHLSDFHQAHSSITTCLLQRTSIVRSSIMQLQALLIGALATMSSAYRISLYSADNYQGTQRSYVSPP